MNGVKFGISKFCGPSNSVMIVIPYAGVFINNAVRALFIFLDTVTASLNIVFPINFIEKKPNVPCLALSNLVSGSYQARA